MAWSPPASDFGLSPSRFPKVSPELQADRDVVAENLIAQYEPGAMTLRDTLQGMRKGKNPGLIDTETDRTPKWEPPAEDFKEEAWSPPKEDFSEEERGVAGTIGQGLLDIPRFIGKGLAAIPGAIGAGLSVPASLATGKDVGEEASKLLEESTSPEVFQPKTFVGRGIEEGFGKAMDVAKRFSTDTLHGGLNSLGVENVTAHGIAEGLGTALPDAAMTAFGIKAMGPRAAKPKPTVESPKAKPTTTEGLLDSLVDKPIEEPGVKPVQGELGLERPEPAQLPLAFTENVKPSVAQSNRQGIGEVMGKYMDDVGQRGPQYTALGKEIEPISNKLTVKDYIDIVEKSDINPFDTLMASKLRDKVDDVRISFQDFSKLEDPKYHGWKGYYSMSDHSIKINVKKVESMSDTVNTINHEGMHAVTSNFIDNNPQHPLTNLTWDLFNTVKKDHKGGEVYGLKDAHEFLAELANPEFADYLNQKSISADLGKRIREETGTKGFIKSAYDGFVRIAGKILGFDPKETNALTAAMQVMSRMVDEQTPRSINKNRVELSLKGEADRRHAKAADDVSAVEKAISKALSYSDSAKEFATKMESSKLPESDIAKVITRSEELFAKKLTITQKIKNEGWKNSVEEHYTRDDRTTPEMLGSLPHKDGNVNIQDINPTGLLWTTSSWASTIKLIGSKNHEAAQVLKHTYDKLQDIKEMGHRLVTKAKPLFDEHAKATKELFHNVDNRLAVAKALDYFEKNTEWFNGKDYYPTKDQLMASGKLTDKQADGYLALAKTSEMTWDNIDMANAKRGEANFPRIPGYVHHGRNGGYYYMLEALGENGSWEAVGKYNFTNAFAARRDLKAKQKNLPEGVRVRTDEWGETINRPHANKGSISDYLTDIRETLDIIKNYKGQFKQLKGLLDKLDSSSTEGVLIHNLERTLNLEGHVMDKLGKGTANPNDIRTVLEIHKKAYEGSVNYLENVSFATDVWQPLMDANLPKYLRKAITDVGDTFIGKDGGIDNWVQEKMNYALSRAGVPVHIVGNATKILTSGFSKYSLMGNAGFYISNVVQPSNGIAAVLRADAKSAIDGGPRGSIAKAFAETAKQMPEILIGKGEMTKLSQGMGKSEPIMMEHFDPKGRFRDPLAEGLERRGRVTTFALGYNYFKQFMPDAKAREAAGALADESMVPYDKDLGRPIAANRAGDVASVFATYMMHDFGQLAHDIKLVANNPKALRSYAPLVAYQGLKYYLYGVGGVALVNSIDEIVRRMNGEGTDVPSIREQIRESGGNDLMEFGAISQGLGLDVSSSGAGVNPGLAMGGVFDLLVTIKRVLVASAQASAHEVFGVGVPVSQEQWAKSIQYTPKSISWYLEEGLQSKDAGDFAKRIVGGWKGERKSTSLKRGSYEAMYERSESETADRARYGSKPLEEAKFDTTVRIFKNKEARLDLESQKLMDLLKDELQGHALDAKTKDYIFSVLGPKMGMTAKEIQKSLAASIVKRTMPYNQRQDKKAAGSKSPGSRMEYQRWKEVNK